MLAKLLCRTTLLAASWMVLWSAQAQAQPPSPNGNAQGWVQGQMAGPRPDWLESAAVAGDVVAFPDHQQNVWSADPQLEDEQVPGVLSSTGGWLRAGEAYFEADFSYLSRSGPRKGMTLAFDRSAANINNNPFEPNQILRINPGQDYAPGTRLTYGRILQGRDSKNRDETLEFTFNGFYKWNQAASLTSRNPNDLITIWEPVRVEPGAVNPGTGFLAGSGYTLSNTQAFTYDTNLNSYEVIYKLRRRLGRDRLVLARDGSWVQTASPSFLPTFIMGPRVVTTRERFSYTANSINNNNSSNDVPVASPVNQNQYSLINSGQYFITTHNDLVGYQIGMELDFQQADWRLGAVLKGGPYVNFTDQTSQATILQPATGTTATTILRDEHRSANVAALVAEINLHGAYYFRPNLAVRAGYDIMWLNSVSHAPSQLTFFPSNPPRLASGGSLFLQGGTLGIEWLR